MNQGLETLKRNWNEEPLAVIAVAAQVTIAFVTLMNALGRRRR